MLWHAWMMNQAQYDSGGCCRFVIPAQAGIHVGILMIGVVLWMLNQVQHDSIMLCRCAAVPL